MSLRRNSRGGPSSRFSTASYDYLVVTPGLKSDFAKIEGLEAALADPNGPVSSIYRLETVEKTWDSIRNFKGGRAVGLGRIQYARNRFLTTSRTCRSSHSRLASSSAQEHHKR